MDDTVEGQAAPQAPTGATAKPSRAETIAALEKLQEPVADEKPIEAKPDAPAEKPDEAVKPDEDADEAPKVEAKPADPELAKRQDAIAKAEKRSRELIAKERAEAKAAFDAEVQKMRAELEPQLEQARQFKAAMEKAKTDPAALLRAAGLTEDDFDYAGRQIYNLGKTAGAKPENKQAAEQARYLREIADRAERAEQRAAALEKQFSERDQSARIAAAENEYLDGVMKAPTDEAPRAAKLIEKSPAKARAKFKAIAEDLLRQNGEIPDHADVLAAYEAELDELGLERPAAKAAAPKPAEPTKPAKTLDPSATGATPAVKPGKKPERNELLAAMPWRE